MFPEFWNQSSISLFRHKIQIYQNLLAFTFHDCHIYLAFKEIRCKGMCDMWCLLSKPNIKDHYSIDTSLYTYSLCIAICIAICTSADGCILWQAWIMFYSRPQLPNWPNQWQILQCKKELSILLIVLLLMKFLLYKFYKKCAILHYFI